MTGGLLEECVYYRAETFLAKADLRLAAWFLWITPFETALSSFLPASANAVAAAALSPAAAASRVARIAVFSSLFTALLRSAAFRLVPMRLICDLMFAMFHFLGVHAALAVARNKFKTLGMNESFVTASNSISSFEVSASKSRGEPQPMCENRKTVTTVPFPEQQRFILSPRATRRLEPAKTDPAFIRNFCIIAHIDHGKSTLADRMLQLTGVVDDRSMRAQYLDRMDIERERGITIKSQAVRMPWEVDGKTYALNMIDTPGHVDFTYEVSRSLAACEGAVLLVDAAQGIEAQTLANLYLAMENDLEIIPVLNKIDLPAAQPEKYAEELANLIGGNPEDCLRVSGKTGMGVDALLDKIVGTIPNPIGDPNAPARAMIFDSVYDSYPAW